MSIVPYPITPEVRTACAQFLGIGQILALPERGRTELEIVRLLDNTHYEHIERLLGFIERVLPRSGSIGKYLLRQTDAFQFDQALAEMFLLGHLWDRLGNAVSPAIKAQGDRVPDLEARWKNQVAWIEVYSPIDLMGFQLIERYIPPLFKYLEVSRGFRLDIAIEPLDLSVEGMWYPYWVPKAPVVRIWLRSLAEKARAWLSQAHPPHHLQLEGPAGKIELRVQIRELTDDPRDRMVTLIPATRSTDTRLLFECGTSQDTARSQWGCNLKRKLAKRQAGPPVPNTVRMLVVDFAHADTAWPDFICWPAIGDRLAGTVKLFQSAIGSPVPYDVLLPAQLGLNCCFGSPIWMEGSTLPATEFIRDAQLDRQCLRRIQDQGPDFEELLEHESFDR